MNIRRIFVERSLYANVWITLQERFKRTFAQTFGEYS